MSFLDVVKRSIGASAHDESSPITKKKAPKPERRNVEYLRARESPLTTRREKPRPEKRPTRSKFSQLSVEITQFQKMIRELESLAQVSSDSPELQWKTRILLRSAREADTDISNKITTCHQSSDDPNIGVSYQKLKRDFLRAHNAFQILSKQHCQQQEKAIAQLSQQHGWSSPTEIQQQVLAQQEEDFFYRAMRERESEIKKMNKSMHKVNDIYEELGKIVQDQQDTIDQVEDKLNDAKATTRAGVDHLQQTFPYCGAMDTDDNDNKSRPPKIRTDEEFRWSMPFETMGQDIREVVEKDIMGLGSDLISMTRSSSVRRATRVFRCSSGGSIEKCASDDNAIVIDDDDSIVA